MIGVGRTMNISLTQASCFLNESRRLLSSSALLHHLRFAASSSPRIHQHFARFEINDLIEIEVKESLSSCCFEVHISSANEANLELVVEIPPRSNQRNVGIGSKCIKMFVARLNRMLFAKTARLSRCCCSQRCSKSA